MKLIKSIIFIALLFGLTISKTKFSSKTAAITIINNNLDNLIASLNNQSKEKITMDLNDQRIFLERESHNNNKKDLKDEILNAFEGLKKDFVYYEEIVYKRGPDEDEKQRNKKEIMKLEHNLNRTINKDDILKEMEEYSSQIDNTFEVLDQIKVYNNRIKQNKNKVLLVHQVQDYLNKLKTILKKNKNKKDLNQNVQENLRNITKLYQNYLHTHKLMNRALLKRFNILMEEENVSLDTGEKITNLMKLYRKIVYLTKILKIENVNKGKGEPKKCQSLIEKILLKNTQIS